MKSVEEIREIVRNRISKKLSKIESDSIERLKDDVEQFRNGVEELKESIDIVVQSAVNRAVSSSGIDKIPLIISNEVSKLRPIHTKEVVEMPVHTVEKTVEVVYNEPKEPAISKQEVIGLINTQLKKFGGVGNMYRYNNGVGNLVELKDVDVSQAQQNSLGQYIIPSPGGVSSVNGQTGGVILKAENIPTNSGSGGGTVEGDLQSLDVRVTTLENNPSTPFYEANNSEITSTYAYWGFNNAIPQYQINRRNVSTFEKTTAIGAWADRLTLTYT